MYKHNKNSNDLNRDCNMDIKYKPIHVLIYGFVWLCLMFKHHIHFIILWHTEHMHVFVTVDLDAKSIFVTNSYFYDSVTIQQSYFFARLIPSAPNAWNVRKFKTWGPFRLKNYISFWQCLAGIQPFLRPFYRSVSNFIKGNTLSV